MTLTNAPTPAAVPQDDAATQAELRELRLRVAAQDRLIAAMIDENESIHQLRRNSHDLVRIYDLYGSRFPFNRAIAALRRIRTSMTRTPVQP